MMTEKLYDADAYLTHFTARVEKCIPDGEGYAVLLDRTAFFPEGGGQAGDSGYLGGVRVRTAIEREGEILHLTDRPLAVGACVEGEIDFDLRFDRMQNHTGEHIVSGLVHRHFGLNNVGFHLGDEEVTFDFDGVLDRAQLDFIEDLANEAVARNMPVVAYYPTEEELAKLTYRAKLDLTEGVRIVHIEDYDDCACCAPHVARTGEVGAIRMIDFIHYKGGIRIRLACGARAVRECRKKSDTLSKISHLLSLPPEECDAGVARLLAALEAQKGESATLARALADARAASIPCGAQENFCFFEDLLGEASTRRLALAGAERTSGLCAVLNGSDEAGYRFCLAGKGHPLRAIAATLRERLSAKCGGSDEMITGRIAAKRAEIEAFFASL